MTEQSQNRDVENYENYEPQGSEIDLLEILFNIFQRFWIVIMVTVVFALVTAVYTFFFVTPLYKSVATVYVITKQNADMITNTDLQTSTSIVNDVLVLVKSRPIIEETLNDVDIEGVDYKTLYNAIDVESPEDTSFMNITVTFPDAYQAEQLVNALARISVEQMEDVLDVKSASIVEEGSIPVTPSSPNLLMNTVLGGVVGFLLACAVIALLVVTNDRIRSADDMERTLRLHCLGAIPEGKDFKSAAEREQEKKEVKERKARAKEKKKKDRKQAGKK